MCAIDIHSKYAWDILLRDKKDIIITKASQKVLEESNSKPNKILVAKGGEFYNRSVKSFLQNDNIEMSSTHNEGTFVFVERFIRTLMNKIYKYMTSISKKSYIDKLDDTFNEYNNTYHKTIRMRPIDENQSMYIHFNENNNKEGPKFKVDDHITIWKHKSDFTKGYVPN